MIALSITAWEMIKMMLEERREMKAKQKAKERAELIKAIKEEICPPIQ
jgi:hypothetical protein